MRTCPLAVCWRQTGSFRCRELSRSRSLPLHRSKQHASPSLCISTTLRRHRHNHYPSFETELPSEIDRRILYAYRCFLLRVLIANLFFWVSPHLCQAYITYPSVAWTFSGRKSFSLSCASVPAVFARLLVGGSSVGGAPPSWRQTHCATPTSRCLHCAPARFHFAIPSLRACAFLPRTRRVCAPATGSSTKGHTFNLLTTHTHNTTQHIHSSTLFCILFQAQHICAPRTDRYNYKRLHPQSFTTITTAYHHHSLFPHSLSRSNTSVPQGQT